MAGGRPSIFTPELGTEICALIANGWSLRKICERDGMPSIDTARRWLIDEDKAEFQVQYANARDEQADFYADEIIDIADSALDAQVARLRIDTRKWVASKLKPKRYADRVDMTSGGEKLTPVLVKFLGDENPQDTSN